MTPSRDMTARQRSPVPFSRSRGRKRDSTGGGAVALTRRTLAPGMDSESTRAPGTTNDGLIAREHTAWYPSDAYSTPGDSWVNWTAAGPCRPELSMRMVNYRLMEGNSRTSNLLSPVQDHRETAPGYLSGSDGRIIQPTHLIRVGLHTDPKSPALSTVQRYTNPAVPQEMPGRQDRLRPGQYTGQSYSQTTRIQGG